MALASGEGALSEVFVTGEFADVLSKRRKALPGLRGKAYAAFPFLRRAIAQVDLVVYDGNRNPARNGLVYFALLRIRCVLDPKHSIRALERSSRPTNALFFDAVRVFSESGRIDELDSQPVNIDLLSQDVARSSRDFGNDSRLLAAQQVQQAGLAGIRLADDDNLKTIAQNATLLCLFLQQGERICTLIEATKQKVIRQEVDFFFRKVDCRFDVHAQADQLFRERIDCAGKSAGQ